PRRGAALLRTTPAASDTPSQLSGARDRLRHLVSQIKSETERVAALRAQLAGVDQRIAQARAKADRIDTTLLRTRTELMQVRAQYQALHDRLDEMARNEYMAGPGSSLEVILGAT